MHWPIIPIFACLFILIILALLILSFFKKVIQKQHQDLEQQDKDKFQNNTINQQVPQDADKKTEISDDAEPVPSDVASQEILAITEPILPYPPTSSTVPPSNANDFPEVVENLTISSSPPMLSVSYDQTDKISVLSPSNPCVVTYQLSENLKSVIQKIQKRIDQMAKGTLIMLGVARYCIKYSMYWDHPTASAIVPAPKHANRLFSQKFPENKARLLIDDIYCNDWKIAFGANIFNASEAIYGCIEVLKDTIKSAEAGALPTKEFMLEQMRCCVTGAVSNYRGDKYASYPCTDRNWMAFGTQFLMPSEFVEGFLRYFPISELWVDPNTSLEFSITPH